MSNSLAQLSEKPFLILLAAVRASTAEESHPVGKDRSDWTFGSQEGAEAGKKSWKVEGGILTTTRLSKGFIRSGNSPRNHALTVEWRWIPARVGRYNNGLLLHTQPTASGKVWPPAMEFQLQQGSAGDFRINDYAPTVATGKRQKIKHRLKRLANPTESLLCEWN